MDTQAIAVALGYVVVALTWIWTSDWLVERLAIGDPRRVQLLQSVKGTAFVLVTGGALHATISVANARRRRLEQEKRLVEEILTVSQRLEAFGTLAGTLVHDFNNVLTVLRGETEILRLENFDSQYVPSHVNAIEHATKRAEHMVNELMLLMRNAPMSLSTGDPTQVLRQSTPVLERTVGNAARVQVEIASPLPSIAYDPSQLERTLINLVANARDAVQDASNKLITVTATALTLRHHQSLFKPEPVSGKFLTISVRDRGCGISRENFARIFTPFFTTKTTGKGTGLGLASVHRVMQSHGGWVEIDSTPGKGACFTLYFPAGPDEAASA